MATTNGYDLRRTDLRSNVLENPYWLTSAEIVALTVEDYTAVLFSFPATSTDNSPGYGTNLICLHSVIFEVCTAVTGSGSVAGTVGWATVAADVCGSPGTADVTTVIVDSLLQSSEITWATPGYYAPRAASTGEWVVESEKGAVFDTANASHAITPVAADGAVPCIVCALTDGAATMTGGTCRLHMLISEVPSGR